MFKSWSFTGQTCPRGEQIANFAPSRCKRAGGWPGWGDQVSYAIVAPRLARSPAHTHVGQALGEHTTAWVATRSGGGS